jgi:hypothetical protein
MSETRENEIRALREMQECDGWQVFVKAVRDQWQGEPFVGRMKMATAGKPGDGIESVRELFAGRAAVESLLNWPENRRKKLEADAKAEEAGTPDVVRRA